MRATPLQCVEYLLPYALTTELRLFVLNNPFGDRRRNQRRPFRTLWRVKVMWIGLAPTYMVGCIKAIAFGPNHRPVYRVTRKTTETAIYGRETLPNLVLACSVPVALIVGIVLDRLPRPVMLIAAGYWGIVASCALAGFVLRGWYGARLPTLVPALERRRPVEQPAARPAPEVPGAPASPQRLLRDPALPARGAAPTTV